MRETFYITTPIYYVNDVPHIGHAYTTVAADVMARYMRLTGRDVFFLTGTDEHGQKIEKAASAAGLTNQEFVDRVAPRFQELWKALNVSNDGFIRTTEPRHKKAVQHLFKLLEQKGYIEKGEYEDWYCVPCESFWTTLQLKEGKCPDCGRAVDKLKEESYFFRLDKDELKDKLLKFADCIKPESRKNEIVSFIKGGLRKLSISRTSFTWGIPVPGDEKHVIYVWLDALANYISGLGWPDDMERFNKFWPANVHVIGKDILRFHAVYWPAFLLAADLPLPKTVFAHGWWTIAGEKMSKSKGNVVDPFAVVEELDRHGVGVDGFRYFLLREIPFGLDGDYSRDALVNRINTDLANDLGNLHFRTINMIEKYLGGEVPSRKYLIEQYDYDGISEEKSRYVSLYNLYDIDSLMQRAAFNEALQVIFGTVTYANRLIDHAAPWSLAKSDTEEDKAHLRNVLAIAARTLKVAAFWLSPFMPTKMRVIWEQLGMEDVIRFEDIKTGEREGGVYPLPEAIYNQPTKIRRGPAPFPRIETDRIRALKAASGGAALTPGPSPIEGRGVKEGKQEKTMTETNIPSTPAPPPPVGGGIKGGGLSQGDGELISIDDFMKVDLRVGKVLEAERVPKSNKLIRMQIDIGSEVRQIVGGIGKAFTPEELVGKTVVVVANLKPAKLMGVESQGMVLAAGDVNTLKLAGFTDDVPRGTKVK